MEWSMVTVIVVLVGLLVTVGGPIAKLIHSITKLTVLLDALSKSLDDAMEKNGKSHARLWEHNAEQDKQLQDHEGRLGKLEQK